MDNDNQEPERMELDPSFGDPIALLNSRNWLQAAIEAKGAKVHGGGCGFGQADLDVTLDGCDFSVSIRPIIKDQP